MDLVFLGPPGAGKGTQAQILEEQFGFKQLSTGDLLRSNIAEGSELGKTARGYMDRGELVPDALIIAMMEPELQGEVDVLLDGFPRTIAQAEALDGLLESRKRPPASAVLFDIDLELLETRLTGRWTNPRTNRVYHEKFNPPRVPGIDDEDGGPLIQRDDDNPATIAKRLAVYREQTAPLVTYYTERQRLVRIDATLPMADVTARILSALQIAVVGLVSIAAGVGSVNHV